MQELKIIKMRQPSTHQAKHAHNRVSPQKGCTTLLDGSQWRTRKITQDPTRQCLQEDAQLPKGSHHKHRNNSINKICLKKKVF